MEPSGGNRFIPLNEEAMRTVCKLTILIVFLFVSLGTASLHAGETEIARITDFTGTITLVKADESEQLVMDLVPLYPGDTLITGKDGYVAFSFNRGDLFKLYEDSQITIDELSGHEEQDQPALRLTLGYLWTRIKVSMAATFSPSFHTPTAVLGIRGTEFETVVSLDAASTVTVDEGAVVVETDKESVVVDTGQATEVEVDDKVARPFTATPREKRDWAKWRAKRKQKLLTTLPKRLPHMRRRFEMAADRFEQFNQKVNEVAIVLATEIETARDAIARRDRRQARRSIKKINTIEKRFRRNSARFRKGLNRLRVAGKHSIRLERFVQNNLTRLPPNKVAGIQADLAAIKLVREQLKERAREAVQTIKGMLRNVRTFRQEVKQMSRTKKRRQN